VVDAEILGEHLVVWVKEQRVEATKPVIVRQGLNEFKAQGLMFDGRTRLLSLQGPARGEFRPPSPARR
jgi:lipopolysaccharide export system protein LptC